MVHSTLLVLLLTQAITTFAYSSPTPPRRQAVAIEKKTPSPRETERSSALRHALPSELDLAQRIHEGVRGGNLTASFNALKQLAAMDPHRFKSPLPALHELLRLLGGQDNQWLDSGVKLLVARQAHRLAHAAFLAKRENGEQRGTSSNMLRQLHEQLDQAARLVEKASQPTSHVRFELDCIAAVLNDMDANGANPRESRAILHDLIALSTEREIHVNQTTVGHLYRRVNHSQYKRWYDIVLVLEFLAKRAKRNEHALQQLQRLLHTHRHGNWHVAHAGIDALAEIVTESKNTQLMLQAYYGSQQEEKTELPGLQDCLTFKKFRSHNNRRIRATVVQRMHPLIAHPNPKIIHSAQNTLANLQTQEEDKHVLLALKRPELIPAVYTALLRDWRVGKSQYKQDLARHRDLLFGGHTEPPRTASTTARQPGPTASHTKVPAAPNTLHSLLHKAVSRLQQTRRDELKQSVTTLQGLSLYIPLQAADRPVRDVEEAAEKKSLYDLHERVMRFLDFKNSSPLLLLQGNSGAGKSLYGRYLERELWNRYHENPATSPIPVFISLPRAYGPGRDLVQRALKQKGLTEKTIQRLQTNARFVLILDGYDEINGRFNIYEQQLLRQWQAKVIVTCRSQHLSDYDSAKLFRVGEQPAPQLHLVPFSQERSTSYITKFARSPYNHAGWQARQYRQALDRFPGLQDMAREPFSLSLILQALPRLYEQHAAETRLTRAQVYEAFSKAWFDQQLDRMLRGGRDLRMEAREAKWVFQQYAQDLGFEMFRRKTQIAVKRDATGKLHPAWRRFFEGEKALFGLESSPLRRVGDGQYMFIHKSYQEYFAACKIIDELLNGRTNKEHGLPLEQRFRADYLLNKQLLNDEPPVIRFIADHVREGDDQTILKQHLWHIVHRSKRDPQVATAAANAMTVLNVANVSFSGIDLRGIRIPGAILDWAVLDMAHLDRSNFKGVSLRQASMAGARLNKANMAGVEFGEHPYEKHTNVVWDVTFSPDGKLLASASGGKFVWDEVESEWKLKKGVDNIVRLWDMKSRKQLRTLKGHTGHVKAVRFSLDGKLLASASVDHTVRLWDTSNGRELAVLHGHTSSVESVSFSHDGKFLASGAGGTFFKFTWHDSKWKIQPGSDKKIIIWDLQSKKKHRIFENESDVQSLDFSPENKLLASAGADGVIRLWDVRRGFKLKAINGHTDVIRAIRFSPDGKRLASAGTDKIVRLWDTTSGRLLRTFAGHSGGAMGVAFSPDGELLASCGTDKQVRLWNVKIGTEIQVFTGHRNGVYNLDFSPDGSRLASAGFDQTVRVWDVNVKTPVLHTNMLSVNPIISAISFSQDGRMLASASADQTVRLWDTSNGSQLKVFKGHTAPVWSVAFSPDRKQLASASEDRTIRLWDVKSGTEIKILKGHWDQVRSVTFSPDGSRLASASDDKTVRVWDVASGKELKTLKKHTKTVRGIDFSPDGNLLASCSADQTIRLWNLANGVQIKVFKGHASLINSIAFSPDGETLASASFDKTVRLWNVQNDTKPKTMRGHTNSVRHARFSSDGLSLASAGGYGDQTVRLWDVHSGKLLKVFAGHNTTVRNVSFSPNGHMLASSGRTIRLLDFTRKDRGANPQVTATVRWRAGQSTLSLTDADFRGVKGLTPDQKALIRQRGGKL